MCQLGAPFDYNIHNAIMRENTDEFGEDEVCKVSKISDVVMRQVACASHLNS